MSEQQQDNNEDSSEDEEDELLRLRHLLARSRQEHTEQNEKIRVLSGTMEQLKTQINQKDETHEAELELVRSEVDVIREETKHSSNLQGERIRQLSTDAAAMSDMEREVKHLRERVSDLLNVLETEGRNHAEETHRLTKESFSLRIKLEQTFRKTLQEIDGKYKEQAFSELARDSKNALVENSKLEEELAIQSIGIESLLERYKKQASKLDASRRDVDMARTTETMRLEQLRTLKQARLTSEARLNHMQENVERLGELRTEFEKCRDELNTTKASLATVVTAKQREANRAEKWKRRAFDLSKQMLELTTIQPMRNDGIPLENRTPKSTGRSIHSTGIPGDARNIDTMSNSSMWSASANDSWRGGVASMATLHGMDPPGSKRMEGQGPGATTLVRRKEKVMHHQSLPVLNPAEAGGPGEGGRRRGKRR